ncbi:MAG TPA: ACT domain-containing protein [Candidatus Merdenecus merdavium]|nr:ACT domain-containing protein [Candidatus Merdenecus merdavium]
MKRAIITVIGKDTVGIIGKVCTYLAEQNVNIVDITQTLLGEYFNMMLITNIEESKRNIQELNLDLEVLGKEIGVIIKCQHEDIFNKMHRI